MAKEGEKARGWGFWAEVVLVSLGVLAVLAWLVALLYVLIFG